MGSLEPDSISSRESVPSRSDSLAPRSTLNTLAASVEAMTEPTSRPTSQSSPSTKWQNAPTMPAHTSTPTVESRMACGATGRASRTLALKPP